ncbi:hypothetical protein [Planococcus salinus]|uniref:hypothetical protein n=1 Tax=Planococcus salinus TaxID=1848460 RepID=UPI001864500B|nr:hypothetical protein [Planococcus salinus]
MRSFFGKDTETKIIKSSCGIDPSRSPFIKERIEGLFEATALPDILKQSAEVYMEMAAF